MNIIYDKNTGKIIGAISDNQDYKEFYSEYGNDFTGSLDSICVEKTPHPLCNYHIKNGKINKYNDWEITENRIYGRILTEEERQLNKLKPSPEEIRKAENAIEILTLVQEVI